MNDVYLWNQKSGSIKLIQEIDFAKIYFDHQRRGLTVLTVDIKTFAYKTFEGNTGKL
jgi:hypothetical protein